MMRAVERQQVHQIPFNDISPELDEESTQALHTYRIFLSPFTKENRVWGALIEKFYLWEESAT